MIQIFPHYLICEACAQERGGEIPEDNPLTSALGFTVRTLCKYCEGKKQVETYILPWVEYAWPNHPEANAYAQEHRE